MGKRGCCNCSSNQYLFLMPLMAGFSFPITFAISYGYSAYNNHVNVNGTEEFPYISETGNKPPESCIFGQLLNIAAVICGLTIYVRYRQTRQALDHYLPSVHVSRTNFVALFVGMIASFGVSMVGNFQMGNMVYTHYVGASLTFGLGAVYAWMQTFLSYELLMFMCSRRVFILRIVISTIVTIFLIGTVVGAQIYGLIPENKSYKWMSTSSEWIMAFGLASLFASFACEFRITKVEKPRISIIQSKIGA